MCYAVYFSTDSLEDFSTLSSDLLRFEPADPREPLVGGLRYKNRWYVGSKSLCSCTFRHLASPELGFGVPEDWCEEEEDELEATLRFIKVVRRVVEAGHRADCIDVWRAEKSGQQGLTEKIVVLADLADEEFRFFENHHSLFELS